MKVFIRRLMLLLVVCTANIPMAAHSATPTKQQMDMFKRLPKSQQAALAKQYGFDISILNQTGQASSNPLVYDQTNVLPREPEQSPMLEQYDPDLQFVPKEKELKRFGLDLFAGEPTTYQPVNSIPVPSDYRMGAGDSLLVNIYGKNSESHDITIGREGLIAIPELPPLNVVGLTFSEVKTALINHISSRKIGVEVSVSMGNLRTMRIFVLGEAYKPGAYVVSSLSTITNALIASGGISDIGSLRKIQLKRDGQLVTELDLYDLLIRGDNSGDMVLRAGDVVFIPTSGDLVSMTGQVRREAIFEMKADETFADLIQMAGGFPSTAYPNKALIERFNGGSLRTLVNLDLSSKQSIGLHPVNGDVITIPGVSEQYKDAISLIGAVVRPGKMQWWEGMRIADVIRSVSGDLMDITDLSYALVVRQSDAAGGINVIQFSPVEAVHQHQSASNVKLQARDKVVVFSRYETIEAENRQLDKFAYTEKEIDQRQQGRLWERYQKKKFMDYIGNEDKVEVDREDLDKQEFSSAGRSLMDLTDAQNFKSVREKDFSLFSRRRLLAPIILKLREQASAGSPVSLVEVDGRVKYPGVYPLPFEGSVKELIVAAGGLLESAYLETAEITRIESNDSVTSVNHIHADLRLVMTEDGSKIAIPLKSKDRLNVLGIPNWQENVTVTLAGEVTFPGKYTIARGEALSSVIARAGGFTEFSSPSAAVFSRASLRVKEREQLTQLSEELRRTIAARNFESNPTSGSTVSYAETKLLLDDLSKVKAVGRLVIDLDKVMDKTADIQLEDGDLLHIPPLVQSVNVIGEVNVATAHIYDKRISIEDYIKKSGGLKQRADQERIYIIKSNGSVVVPDSKDWFTVQYDDVAIDAGDTIVVPLDSDHMNNLTLWSTATQILYQLGVAVAAIGSL